jgi:hypothetical protein
MCGRPFLLVITDIFLKKLSHAGSFARYAAGAPPRPALPVSLPR